MTRFIYNFLIILSFPIWFLWMQYRVKKRKNAPNWQQRWGHYPNIVGTTDNRIWLHAVSVGEVMAAKPILNQLRTLLPEAKILLTTTTSTGNEVAQSLIGKSVDQLLYFPIDAPWAAKRAFKTIQPKLFLILETELWLNCLFYARKCGTKSLLLNGRLSDKSYKSSIAIKFFYQKMLALLDAILVQTDIDKMRFESLGAKNVTVIGNSKFDEPKSDPINLPIAKEYIIIGSVRGEFEENFILEAISGLNQNIVFAPRHIERAVPIAVKATALGFNVGFRSKEQWDKPFLILDSYGELAGLYSEAMLAIIGGGFDNLGGQNIIQPMAVGCTVICGPNMKNFREPFELAKQEGALLVASTPGNLKDKIMVLVNSPELRATMGEKGIQLVEKNKGAAAKYAAIIKKEFNS